MRSSEEASSLHQKVLYIWSCSLEQNNSFIFEQWVDNQDQRSTTSTVGLEAAVFFLPLMLPDMVFTIFRKALLLPFLSGGLDVSTAYFSTGFRTSFRLSEWIYYSDSWMTVFSVQKQWVHCPLLQSWWWIPLDLFTLWNIDTVWREPGCRKQRMGIGKRGCAVTHFPAPVLSGL